MIELPVEKEVNKKNKIFKGFTLRQMIAIVTGFGAGALVTLLTGLPIEEAWYVFLIGGVIIWGLGWYNKNGLFIEHLLAKKIRILAYGNNKRSYRTMNRYISVYNKEYDNLKRKDYSDKKYIKKVKRAEKQLKKKKL